MKNLFKKILSTSLLVLPMAALASSHTTFRGEQVDANRVTLGNITILVQTVVNFLGSMFFAISAVFILYAGYLYLTAGGEAEKVGTAKTQLIYSLIAIAIGLVAFSATAIVKNFLTTGGA